MKLNIFVLHNVRSFARTLSNIADYALCFERYAPQHNYFYHKITDPITAAMRDMRFHAIIVDSTALGIVRYRPRELWYAEKERWSFIGDSDAVKLVFPQDDYHQSKELDALFVDWKFDVVYAAVPKHHEMLYPRYSKVGCVETALTGYVDDNSITFADACAKPFEARGIDLCQRVTFYSPLGGRLAQLKGRFALAMKDAAQKAGMRVDISTRDEDRILGTDWFHFLGNGCYITGCPTGVSVWDPDGIIFDKVEAYRAAHPAASFEEVEAACFPGLDGLYDFSTVSPRLFEAAMMRCGQILIEASYLGALKPFEHYLPVKPDLSNIVDTVDAMRDAEGAKKRIALCYDALIGASEFRYSTFVLRIMNQIAEVMTRRHVTGSPDAELQRLKARHVAELERAKGARVAFGALLAGARIVLPKRARNAIKRRIYDKLA